MLGPDDLVFSSVPVAHVPLFDRLAPVRDAGFAGISLLPDDIWALGQAGVDAAAAAARIADHGLVVAEIDCIGTWLPGHRHASGGGTFAPVLRTLTPERVMAAAAGVGARSVTVVEMFGVVPAIDEAAEAFARLCDMGADHGLIVHIEFLPFGGIPDLASAWAIVEAAGRRNGGLTIDTCHLFRAGSTLDQLSRIPGSAIATVQISDLRDLPDGTLQREMAPRLLPGEGALDVAGTIRTLDAIGSRAPIGVEIFRPEDERPPIDEIARSWADAARAAIAQARS